MVAQRYEIYLWVFKSRMSEISIWTQDEFYISKQPCNILFII